MFMQLSHTVLHKYAHFYKVTQVSPAPLLIKMVVFFCLKNTAS